MPTVKPKSFGNFKVADLELADWNYKEDDADKMQKLIENIRRNGLIENLIIRDHPTIKGRYEVVNGNHRLEALRTLEAEDIQFSEAHCYYTGDITLQAAQRIAIETNETRFSSNDMKMAKVISSILEKYEPTEAERTMPYSAEQLESMSKISKMEWEEIPSQLDIVRSEGEKVIKLEVSRETYDKIHAIITQEDEESADSVKIAILTKTEIVLDAERFDKFCNLFGINKKNKVNPPLLMQYIDSQA